MRVNKITGECSLQMIRSLKDLPFGKLMEIYREGNLENAREMFPELETEGRLLYAAEQAFYQYLQTFFSQRDSFYFLFEQDEIPVCAARVEPFQDGYLLEALETDPSRRCKGYATALLIAIGEHMSQNGRLPLYSHVGKKNAASLRVHKKAGFLEHLPYSVYVDGSVSRNAVTLVYKK